MIKFLKIGGLGLLALILLGGLVFWTPDTDRAQMMDKYTNSESGFVTDAKGLAIHYRDEGNRGGPAILLVHGSGGSLHTWEDMIAFLSDDYRLVSLDLPGHGLTGPHPKRDYSAAAMIGSIETVMETLGLEEAVIAGNSMGGWAAWRYALAAPEKVSGLILIDASGPQIEEKSNPYLAAKIIRSPIGQRIGQKITPRQIVLQTLTQVMANEEQITDELVDRYWELARFPGNRQAMVDRSNTVREPQYWNLIGEVDVPVLILWGEQDVTTPLAFAAAFDEAIKDTTLIIYPGAAHLPMEEIPEAVAGDIRNWMQEKFP